MNKDSKVKTFLLYYLPLLLWMGVIYALSDYRGYAPHPGELPLGQWLLRKGAHVSEYFLLTLLMFRVVWRYLSRRAVWAFGLTGLLSLLYAVSDEVHQHFVPLREGKASDVAIDAIGIALALLVFFVAWRISRRRKK